MVFIVNLKWLSFKQDLSSISRYLEDQKSTYAILRYAYDIPQSVYSEVMDILIENKECIYYNKLLNLVNEYDKAIQANITGEDEYVETIYYNTSTNEILKQDELLIEEDIGQ
jgi:hypothetical protein